MAHRSFHFKAYSIGSVGDKVTTETIKAKCNFSLNQGKPNQINLPAKDKNGMKYKNHIKSLKELARAKCLKEALATLPPQPSGPERGSFSSPCCPEVEVPSQLVLRETVLQALKQTWYWHPQAEQAWAQCWSDRVGAPMPCWPLWGRRETNANGGVAFPPGWWRHSLKASIHIIQRHNLKCSCWNPATIP